MSMHEDLVRVNDMLKYAREAIKLLGDANRDQLGSNRVMQLALTRLVEIVGEAATRVSLASQKAAPEIPWPQIIGMRNRLVHGYDVIDYDLLWDTVNNDLPPLIDALKAYLAKEL